jgi:hypothetical protein
MDDDVDRVVVVLAWHRFPPEKKTRCMVSDWQ